MAEVRWTPQQAEAIRSQDNTLLVANAGTGKTTTVVGKVLWLLGLDYGIDPETGGPLRGTADPCELSEIAAVTFTEKAAYDLKRKLREALEASSRAEQLRWQLDRASIGTIHSFCGTLLREHALRLDIDPTFKIVDANESWAAQDDLIRERVMTRLSTGDALTARLLKGLRLNGSDFASGLVDHVRDVMRDLRWRSPRYREWCHEGRLDAGRLKALAGAWDEGDDVSLAETDALLSLATDALRDWEAWLIEENARDFDSLVLDVLRLLTDRAGEGADAALEGIRRRYRVLIIDEFQDTDFAQRDIAFAIGGDSARPQLFLVGDPKQSIYRFRGADVAVWNSVRSRLEASGRVLELSTNFRCDPEIVEFSNRAAGEALDRTAAALAAESPESSIPYTPLVAGVPAAAHAGIEWLEPGEGKDAEARLVVTRLREMLESGAPVTDPETGQARACCASDVAILYRNRTGLDRIEGALTDAGIPYWLAGTPNLGRRQEVLDLINALRLIRNPRDDLRALGFLRSPFVCLRDEVVTRIRLELSSAPLLVAARRWLDGDWFEAPEDPRVAGVEREALVRGLDTIEALRHLAPRLPLDELLEELLERTGYRLHLVLAEGAEEALANIQSFVHFAEGYRDLDIDTFLEVWDRWSSRDLGIPQAPLYSKQDQVVTLTTVHAAKGLEWPVVFVVGLEKRRWSEPSRRFLADRQLGPVLCARQQERGARNTRIVVRDALEADAEEARLVYVALTRARDRLLLAGARGTERSYAQWFEPLLSSGGLTITAGGESDLDRPSPTRLIPDPAWLGRLRFAAPDPRVGPAALPPLRFIVSATELMARSDDPDAYERRFVHGVLAPWEFAPERRPDGSVRLPPTVRGTLIHGVLERIRAIEELSMILEETIGGLDDPELEQMLVRGSGPRTQLEGEIARVVASAEWAWYIDGEHHRELQFAHLIGAREWRIGAFDLYRPGGEAAPAAGAQLGLFPGSEQPALVIDFKTHEIDGRRAATVARDYAIQARIYREAAAVRGPAQVRLHFTGPNVVIEMPTREPPPDGP